MSTLGLGTRSYSFPPSLPLPENGLGCETISISQRFTMRLPPASNSIQTDFFLQRPCRAACLWWRGTRPELSSFLCVCQGISNLSDKLSIPCSPSQCPPYPPTPASKRKKCKTSYLILVLGSPGVLPGLEPDLTLFPTALEACCLKGTESAGVIQVSRSTNPPPPW